MKHPTPLLLAGLVALAAAGAVQAQTTTSASLKGFSYQLIDLDTTDGISASLTLTPVSTWLAARGFDPGSYTPNPLQIVDEAGTASVANQTGSALATYDGSVMSTSQASTAPGYRMAADVIQTWGFLLSPNTRVIFSAFASVSSQSSVDGYAFGGAGLNGSTRAADGYPSYYFDDIRLSDGSESRLVSFSVTASQAGLSGMVRAGVSGSAEQYLTPLPVPEPSTYALLLAGLALVGTRLRRRQL